MFWQFRESKVVGWSSLSCVASKKNKVVEVFPTRSNRSKKVGTDMLLFNLSHCSLTSALKRKTHRKVVGRSSLSCVESKVYQSSRGVPNVSFQNFEQSSRGSS